MASIAAKIGCSSHTLLDRVKKAEVIHRRGPWKLIEAVEFATFEWVDWFNHRRLMGPTGDMPPANAEEPYYAMLDEPAMAAQLKPTVSDKPGAVHNCSGIFVFAVAITLQRSVNHFDCGTFLR